MVFQLERVILCFQFCLIRCELLLFRRWYPNAFWFQNLLGWLFSKIVPDFTVVVVAFWGMISKIIFLYRLDWDEFLIKFWQRFQFVRDFFMLVRFIFKGISYVKLKAKYPFLILKGLLLWDSSGLIFFYGVHYY